MGESAIVEVLSEVSALDDEVVVEGDTVVRALIYNLIEAGHAEDWLLL